MSETKTRGPRVEESFERLDADAHQAIDGDGARRAAVAAATAAVAGAILGAAKAMLDARGADVDDDEPEVSEPREDDAQPDAGEQPRQQPERGADDEQEEEEPESPALSPAHSFAASRQSDEAEPAEEPAKEDDEDEQEDDADSLRDADNARGNAADVIAKAREQLAGLIGREPETVSGIERADGHWSVSLEVVELNRVPETTDVLATYEVVLDDDGNVSRLRQTRRYLRSQTDSAR
jgi:gas vesicle protein GvpO